MHTVQKKSFHEARLRKVVPLVPTVVQLRRLNNSYQKCRLGFLLCVLFSALSYLFYTLEIINDLNQESSYLSNCSQTMLFTWFTGVFLECILQLYSVLKSALDPATARVRQISAIFFPDQYLAVKEIKEDILKWSKN